MNFLAYDSAPLKNLVAHLKNNPKSRGNAWIIGLYRSFMGETIHKNDIAINWQGNISIYSSKEAYLLKVELIFLDI